MGAPKTKTEYMDMEITAAVERVDFGEHGKFYDRFIHPCRAFTKFEFAKAMKGNSLSPMKYRAVIFALIAATDRINAARSLPAHHIAPLVPEETASPLVGRYVEEYMAITNQGSV
jgi:hypothetical protein